MLPHRTRPGAVLSVRSFSESDQRKVLSRRCVDRSSGSQSGFAVLQAGVLGAGVADFGGAAFGAHAAVGFWPGGQGCVVLCPVDDGSLVAPMHEFGHGGLVVAGGHVAAHVFVAVPGGHGPERPAAVHQ